MILVRVVPIATVLSPYWKRPRPGEGGRPEARANRGSMGYVVHLIDEQSKRERGGSDDPGGA